MLKKFYFKSTKAGVYICDKCDRHLQRDEAGVGVVSHTGLTSYFHLAHQPKDIDLAEGALERIVLGNLHYFKHLGDPNPVEPGLILVWWRIALELVETKEYDLIVWGMLINTAANYLNVGDFDVIEAYTWAQRIIDAVPNQYKG